MGAERPGGSESERTRSESQSPKNSPFPRIPEPRPRRPKRRSFNPSGKEALFSVADSGAGRRISGEAVADAMGSGRAALFGPGRKEIGMARVDCSSCGRSARISWLQLALARFPLSVWIPFKRYDHFMRCPSCARMTWSSVSFFG